MSVAKKSPNNTGNFLTISTHPCRKSDAWWSTDSLKSGLQVYCAILLGSALLATAMTAQATDWQSLGEISLAAEEFVRDRIGKTDRRVKPQAGPLDPRMRLPSCDIDLEPFLRRGTSLSGRTVIGVRCRGSRPWKVYVPVDIAVTESVLIAKRTLPRGHVFAANDLMTEDRDVSRLPGGYLSNPEDVIGRRLKHQIMSGKIVTPSLLLADLVVKRGQSVTLVARNNGLHITMAGKALMDGAVNQRIRVENTASQRVVEGLVRSAEYVEILVQ